MIGAQAQAKKKNSPASHKPQQKMKLKPFQTFFLIITLWFFHSAGNFANAEAITGTIDSVIKGDSISIISKGKEVEVRLFGIDTPEKTQAFGQDARNFTGSMASGKEIRVTPITKDPDGRTVAMVFVNGVNLNEQIIKQGFGWVSLQYCRERFCADWLKLQLIAKASQKGLWADAHPIPPWEYRQNRRNSSESNGRALAVIPSAGGTNVPGGSVAYRGDRESHVFHSSACKDFKCPKCTVSFSSISEALDAGYKPHRECLLK